MVSINIPDLFPPEQNALIHIITICVTTSNINRKKNVRALSLSLKNKKRRVKIVSQRKKVKNQILSSLYHQQPISHLGPTTQTQPLFYYIKLQNYSDPCNTIKHLTISNSTTERAHVNLHQDTRQ
ncbi:hypothetical protein DPMN_049663 [Dreissena polymorpha]|uniref:Uncharacterized protein n=1 Tax=Dreissena polymorpha TaxID=45954 RepID=A0A9D4HNI4_DREPO|nr:hypothetical protein DPMN_049663 [Dreissena polymorpha]